MLPVGKSGPLSRTSIKLLLVVSPSGLSILAANAIDDFRPKFAGQVFGRQFDPRIPVAAVDEQFERALPGKPTAFSVVVFVRKLGRNRPVVLPPMSALKAETR